MASTEGDHQSKQPIQHEGEPITLYANHTEVGLTTWDVRFIFGESLGVENNTIKVKPLAKVYLSPGHAKAILKLLSDHIAEYEKRFGEINPDLSKAKLPSK